MVTASVMKELNNSLQKHDSFTQGKNYWRTQRAETNQKLIENESIKTLSELTRIKVSLGIQGL